MSVVDKIIMFSNFDCDNTTISNRKTVKKLFVWRGNYWSHVVRSTRSCLRFLRKAAVFLLITELWKERATMLSYLHAALLGVKGRGHFNVFVFLEEIN